MLSSPLPMSVNGAMHEMYLSHDVQNKLVGLAAKLITQSFMKEVHEAKYFVIIAGTTTDVTKTEQLSLILHYVTVSNRKAAID